jgi:hypothetical protein
MPREAFPRKLLDSARRREPSADYGEFGADPGWPSVMTRPSPGVPSCHLAQVRRATRLRFSLK